MINAKVTTDKGNIAILEGICKRDRTERWIQNRDTDGKNTTLSQDAVDSTAFKRRFYSKTVIGIPRVCMHKLDVDGTIRIEPSNN